MLQKHPKIEIFPLYYFISKMASATTLLIRPVQCARRFSYVQLPACQLGRCCSLDLLLQIIKLRGREEFSKGDVQTVAQLLDRQNFGIGAPTIKDILHG